MIIKKASVLINNNFIYCKNDVNDFYFLSNKNVKSLNENRKIYYYFVQ